MQFRSRLFDPGLRFAQVGLGPSELRPGHVHEGSGLGQVGLRLLDGRLDFRSEDFGQKVAFLDAGADVHLLVLQIAGHLGVELDVIEGLNRRRPGQTAAHAALPGPHHADPDSRFRCCGGGLLFPAERMTVAQQPDRAGDHGDKNKRA